MPVTAQSTVQGSQPTAAYQTFTDGVPAAQPSGSVTVPQAGAALPATQQPLTGPSMAADRAGIVPAAAAAKTTNTVVVDRGAGENAALMVVGGAALVAGLLIGGNGGAAIAIGGAVIGLYGLFNYMK